MAEVELVDSKKAEVVPLHFSFIWWFSLLFLTCAPVNYRPPIVSFPINSQPEWLKSMSRLPMVASPHASYVLGPSNLLCGKVWRPPSALAVKARGRSTPPPSCCAPPAASRTGARSRRAPAAWCDRRARRIRKAPCFWAGSLEGRGKR